MRDFIRTLNHFIAAVSLLLGITSTTVFAGTLGPIKSSNWYLGAAVSALWADLPSSITINNGAASPYNTDLFTVTNGTKSSVALTLGREWHRSTDWFPVYALGLQYERFILGSIKGTITQYQLPQFLNYSYTWNTHADLLSLYSKITLVQYGRFSPFINGGIGWAMNRSSHFYAAAFPGTTARFSPAFGDHTQNNVAFNLGAGVNYDLSAQWSASLAYNYQYLGTLRSSNGADTWAGEYLNIKNYQINMLSLGAAYHFD